MYSGPNFLSSCAWSVAISFAVYSFIRRWGSSNGLPDAFPVELGIMTHAGPPRCWSPTLRETRLASFRGMGLFERPFAHAGILMVYGEEYEHSYGTVIRCQSQAQRNGCDGREWWCWWMLEMNAVTRDGCRGGSRNHVLTTAATILKDYQYIK